MYKSVLQIKSMKSKCLKRGKYWGEKKVKVYLWMNALLEPKF